MTKLNWWNAVCVTFTMFVAVAGAQAQVFTTLAEFNGNNGRNPNLMSLVQGADGGLYGTASQGGLNAQGTIFRVAPSGNLTTIYNFCEQAGCTDAAYPLAGLILSNDGDFYGTTNIGGADDHGTVYKISPHGTFTTLHSFDLSDGSNPQAPLIQTTDRNFYGTTLIGGSNPHLCGDAGCGTVFKINSTGALVRASFNFSDGAEPEAPLVQASDGNFYGTTPQGGANSNCGTGGCGTVFMATPLGALTTLYNFCSQADCADGYQPIGGLVQGTDGAFYGTTALGGADLSDCVSGCGTVFKITASGVLTTLHSFDLTDGATPIAGLIQVTDNSFYGTTDFGGSSACDGGCGTVFAITAAGALTTLHEFDNADGAAPQGGLLQGTNGTLYGTTIVGGNLDCDQPQGCGTVFSLDIGLAPFVAFVQDSGKVGQTGGILGQGFTGTTSVMLNGVPANFAVVSDTFIKATVPPGATTGYVTVTTATGVLTSNVPFRVLQ